jgi:hypothetical protein
MKVAIRMCDCTRIAMTTFLPITGTSRSPMGMPCHLLHDARAPVGRFVRHLLRAVRTVDSWMGAGAGDPPEGHGRRSRLRSGPRRALQPLLRRAPRHPANAPQTPGGYRRGRSRRRRPSTGSPATTPRRVVAPRTRTSISPPSYLGAAGTRRRSPHSVPRCRRYSLPAPSGCPGRLAATDRAPPSPRRRRAAGWSSGAFSRTPRSGAGALCCGRWRTPSRPPAREGPGVVEVTPLLFTPYDRGCSYFFLVSARIANTSSISARRLSGGRSLGWMVCFLP